MFTFHSKKNRYTNYYIIIYILLSYIVTIEIRYSVINFFTDGHMKVMRRGHTKVNYCLFDHSRRDAIARKHVNGSRKFPLRLENRRHELIDPLISVTIIGVVQLSLH